VARWGERTRPGTPETETEEAGQAIISD
jgi:hypothetical protein